MTFEGLLLKLAKHAIQLRRDGDRLRYLAAKDTLDAELLEALAHHKQALLQWLGAETDTWITPQKNITPDLLPLVTLTQPEIDRIIQAIPGGAANIQDIYPLAPLQEGIFFHHLLGQTGDAYLLPSILAFGSRQHLDDFLFALQAIIARHDILRTAVLWEELPRPVQVVLRRAPLPVTQVSLNGGSAAEELRHYIEPGKNRLDIRKAPLMRIYVAEDKTEERWLMGLLNHHLAMDHTSLDIMIEEVQAHLLGEADRLPRPLPFRNFVAQARLGVSQEAHEAFFQQMLKDVDEPTAPFGLADIKGDGSGIVEARLPLESALATDLRDCARQLGVSVASICHLAWAKVLAALCGREEVVFGTVLFGRMQGNQGADRVLGMFINTLPVRINVGEDSVAQAAKKTHALLAQLLRHEHAPLALAQRCSAVKPPAPLFTALLNYRYSREEAASVSEQALWEDMQVLYSEERTNYPFGLSVDDLGEDFSLTAQVQSSIDPLRVCRYMHTALTHLTKALKKTPELPVCAIEMLPEAERGKVLFEWNQTHVDYPKDVCIHELFEAQAAKTPEAVAVRCGERMLTYAELNRRANRLAHHLIAIGIVPDARVAVGVTRSLEMVVGVLAILKAGGAYVPLDPTYPAERLAYMLEESAPLALLTHGSLRKRWETLSPKISIVALDAEIGEVGGLSSISNISGDNPEPRKLNLSDANLAYVIYTSGSTGKPKGVMVTHHSVANLVLAQIHDYAVTPESRVLQFVSFSFDVFVSELFMTLCAGAALYVPEKGGVLAVEKLLQTALQHKITHLSLPSSVLAVLPPSTDLDSVDCLIVGGDALPGTLMRHWAENRGLFNAYGPTEATVCATHYRCDARDEGNPPIGKPIANTRIYILDEKQRPVPMGVAGELYIAGRGVARGYLGRPDLTAQRFLSDPFVTLTDEDPSPRMYRTGDLGRWLPNGTIEFLGRTDFQVKIRGFRIELGEIESKISNLSGILDAVVVAREDAPGDKRLTAYYTGSHAYAAETLRDRLSSELPDFMIPSAYVHLDTFPLTVNGKLDRNALPAPVGDAFSTRTYEAPEDEVEEALSKIWARLLKVDRVGRHDHFFELGGHSLLALTLIARIRTQLGVEVPLPELFAHPHLADFAKLVKSAVKSTLPAITTRDRSDNLPLSFAQQRLWFLSQLDHKAGAAYHITGGVKLKGALDPVVLKAALDRIVERHEALRTTFTQVDGVAVQVFKTPTGGFGWVEHDLTQSPSSELVRITEMEAGAPFDLAMGPLIRGRLLRLSNEVRVLLITMHHIVSDGWSMGVFINELSAIYQAFCRGETDPLPALAIQYADYALWQRRWLEGEVLQQQLAYWTSHLKRAPAFLELPTDHPRPSVQDYTGASIAVQFDPKLSQALTAMSRRHGVTLFMTFLAGWAAFLSRISGQDDIVVGTPTANRTRTEIEPLIGFFVNTLPLRVDLSGSPTVAELLMRVKEVTLNAQDHQDIPFEQVVEALKPVRDLGRSPLFQVMFAWQNTPEAHLDLEGLTLEKITPEHRPAQFDLSLTLMETAQGIAGELIYAAALFERDTLLRHLTNWKLLLSAMVADDRRTVGRLEMLSAAERRKVLYDWNQTQTDYPRDACIHELFESQAEKTPEAVAVRCDDRKITYAQLNQRANQLAHRLIALGVGPDTRVAIGVERNLEMVVGLLAILKAGGAYVPLDPAYPAERLSFMLEDSAPLALLTQSQLEDRWERLPEEVTVIKLDRNDFLREEGAFQNPDPKALGLTSRHLAYVIYTSGSTGRPKGVALAHGNAVNFICWARQAFAQKALDQTLFSTSLNFDLSVFECFVPLCSGTTVNIVSNALDLIGAQIDVSLINTVPSAIKALLESQALPATARTINLAGEPLKRDLAERVLATGHVDTLCNLYGPSETTTYSTWVRMQEREGFVAHIGRPVANTRIYILDAYRQPVPVGVVGELYIGGAGVARGYLNRPELTAERFLPDPFAPGDEPEAVMYKTGDLGRYLPDGNIEYLGRNDFQVKIRGHRIELGEIEARLADMAGIKDAVVHVWTDTAQEQRLVAYYTADEELGAEALRNQLSITLPEYMVPMAYMQLAKIPLTPNGKLDRGALPAPQGDAFGTRAYEPPEGAVEEALARMWAELLQVDRVGRNDHFFELGGHSLLAVTLISRMEKEGMHVGVRAIFATPTLAGLAATIESTLPVPIQVPENRIPQDCRHITPDLLPLVTLTPSEIDGMTRAVPGGAANIQDIYPLAPLQEGLLFHYLFTETSDAYLVPIILAFDSRQRLDDFLFALKAVIARHDILRTAVFWEGLSEPVQVVLREAPLPVMQVSLSAKDAADELRAFMVPSRNHMDIRQAPLMRAFVAEDAAENRWMLGLLNHLLVSDHTTLELIIEEIHMRLSGKQDQLLPPLPFRNFVVQARLGVSREEHQAFFGNMLGSVDEPTLPFGLSDALGDGSMLTTAQLMMESTLAMHLRDLARHLEVSVASLCHLAWAKVLAHLCGRNDVVFGTVLLGRMQGYAGADRALGTFINTLPVRIEVENDSVAQAVNKTHKLLADLMHHEHAPLALAQRCSAVPPPTPLFTALLNYRYNVVKGDWKGIEMLHGEEWSNYPLALSVSDLDDDFLLGVQVQKPFDPLRVCRYMQTTLANLVEALTEAPETPLGCLAVLPAAESRQVLFDWNETRTDYPKHGCLHELFEAQAGKTPDAVAVTCKERNLTFAELNRRANRLAHQLIALGVGPDRQVALGGLRSLEMVAGLLGILKAGGACVPLDPDYPSERLAFMLKDSAPLALLTQQSLNDRWADLCGNVPVIELDAPAGDSGEFPPINPDVHQMGLSPSHLAYVVYTSGSTGTPHGVMVTHQNLTHLVHWHCHAFQLRPGDRSSCLAGLGFDAVAWEIWPPLCSGGMLELAPAGVSQDPSALLAWWQDRPLDVSFLPTPLAEFVSTFGMGNGRLRHLLIGGDQLRRLPHLSSTVSLVNNYGPTETTVVATSGALDASDTVLHIGRPIANTRVYILDRNLRPVPIFVSGELYIAGTGVARGYLNRPELTAERFLPDPFVPAGESGARMYKTGDVGRFLPDGNIEFLGRNDFQVKIRGYRVAPGEIEANLVGLCGIREAVVLAREDEPGEKRLTAYYSGGDEISAEALRAKLSKKLPENMVPEAYVRLEKLPLTPNGKIDRKALPIPADDAYGLRVYEAPQGEVEKTIARIWAELLKVERVGRQDHFFELGGHSLLSIRMTSRLEEAGFRIPLAAFFTYPTLERLAAYLKEQQSQTFLHGAVPLRPDGEKRPLFLVHDVSGEVTYGLPLSRHIDDTIPVYGLPGSSLAETPPRTVHAQAQRLVRMIRAVQPAGPYHIAGWSLGGILAYEAATQLLGEDETVAFLGLMDTAIGAGKNRDLPEEDCAAFLAMARDAGMDHELLAELENLSGGADFGMLLKKLQEERFIPKLLNEAEIRRYLLRVRAYYAASRDYYPQPIPTPVHYFRAMDASNGCENPLSGWAMVLPEKRIRIVPVPGNHQTMMALPHIETLGRSLSDAIREAGTSQITSSRNGHIPLITIQAGERDQTPLFCVPGAGGNITVFKDLAEVLVPINSN